MFGRKKNLEQDHAPQADKRYEKKYTEDSFWDKVVKFAKTAGRLSRKSARAIPQLRLTI